MIIRKIFYLLLLSLIVLTSSCHENNQKEKIATHNTPTQSKLLVIDSLLVPLDSVQSYSYDFCLIQDSILFIIDKQDQVWLWNLKNNLIKRFSKKGKGPGEYILPVAISAFNKDSIFIIDRQLYKVVLLDVEGKFKQNWNIYLSDKENEPTTFHAFSRPFKENGNIFLEYVSRCKKYAMEDERYYLNTRVLTTFNLNKNIHEYFFPYEKDSPYRQKQFFISPFDPHIDFNGSKYAVVFPHDFRIYVYDKNKNLHKTIEQLPYKFTPKPEGTTFNKKDINFSRDYVKYNVKKNALNNNILFLKNSPNVLIRQYTCPLSNSQIPDDINYWRINYFKQEKYLQIIDIESNKIVEEGVQIPEKLGKIVYAEKIDKIIFSSNPKLNEANILYIAKIVKNEN